MKKLLIITAISIALMDCKKDLVRIDHIPQDIAALNAKMDGHYYNVKGDIFNKGAYQPVNPMLVKEVYFNTAEYIPYAKAMARQANGSDTSSIIWYIPVEDLK